MCKSSEAGEAQFVWKLKTNRPGVSLMVQWLGLLRVLVQSSAGGPRSHKLQGEANKTEAKESLNAGGRVAEGKVS